MTAPATTAPMHKAAANPTIDITQFVGVHGTPSKFVQEGTHQRGAWATLCSIIDNIPPFDTKDDQPLIKLGRYKEDKWQAYDKEKGLEDCPLITCSGLELDYDLEKMQMEEAAERLKAAGIASYLHPSFSATPECPRWRVLVPFAEPLADVAKRSYWLAVLDCIVSGIPFESIEFENKGMLRGVVGGVASKESYTVKQRYYVGRNPAQPYRPIKIDGQCIDTVKPCREAAQGLHARTDAAVIAEYKQAQEAAQKRQKERAKRVAAGGTELSPIEGYNDQTDLRYLLRMHGYTQHGDKFCHPNSESKEAGLNILKGDDGRERAYSHNGSDPLADGKAHDAFDVFRILEHGGDERAAVAAAGDIVLTADGSTITEHNRKLYKEAKAKEAKKTKQDKAKEAESSGRMYAGMPESKLANIMARALKDVFLFDTVSENWYTKTGDIWKKTPPTTIKRAVDRAFDKDFGETGYKLATVNAVETFLKIRMATHNEWEEARHLLPMANGVLNLNTKQLEPYGVRRFVWQLPYSFDPSATCPTIKRYLIAATGGNREVIRFLLAWLWVVVHGRHDLQRFLELTGDGGTGKGTFIELLKSLVGHENIAVTELKLLEGRFETASLKDKRLCLITDSSRYAGEVSQLKAITGSDPLRFEEKNKPVGGTFVYKGLVVIAANEAITSSDLTTGLARRRSPVTLDHVVSEKEKQRYRKEGSIATVMKDQLPGLFNWLLSFDPVEVIKVIAEPHGEMKRQKVAQELNTNSVLAWINDNIVKSDTKMESYIGTKKDSSITHIYPNYVEWCDSRGLSPVATQRFTPLVLQQCKSHKITTEHRTGYRAKSGGQGAVFIGLRLRRPCDENIPLLIDGGVTGMDRADIADPLYSDVRG